MRPTNQIGFKLWFFKMEKRLIIKPDRLERDRIQLSNAGLGVLQYGGRVGFNDPTDARRLDSDTAAQSKMASA